MMKLLIVIFCMLLFTSFSIGNGDMGRRSSRRKDAVITTLDESGRETDLVNRTTEESVPDMGDEAGENNLPD